MKILTGYLKGRLIEVRASGGMRPTSDLVRKSIFDTLQGALEGKRVLDLFSGTGALGFEALSSGVREVIWVEMDPVQARGIEKTLKSFGLEHCGRVIESDVLRALGRLGRHSECFDLIFLDPPYHKGLGLKTLVLISESPVFHKKTILVLETHKTEDPPETIGTLRCLKTKKHGDTKITFYGVS